MLGFVACEGFSIFSIGALPFKLLAGLLVGAVEKILEVYIGPYFKGGIEAWAPYMLSILFLLYRPEGLFGEKIIRRV